MVPKNGDPAIQLFIPTIGVSQKIRRILREKVNSGKKYDESFASMSPFIIPPSALKYCGWASPSRSSKSLWEDLRLSLFELSTYI